MDLEKSQWLVLLDIRAEMLPTAARLKYAKMRLAAWENGSVPSAELVPMWRTYRRAFRKLVRNLQKENRKLETER
jgi:hypothetical protein